MQASGPLQNAGPLAAATPLQQTGPVGMPGNLAFGEPPPAGGMPNIPFQEANFIPAALGGNPLCIVLPCHRVLPASGGVGGYAGGPAAKEHLLALEAAHAA